MNWNNALLDQSCSPTSVPDVVLNKLLSNVNNPSHRTVELLQRLLLRTLAADAQLKAPLVAFFWCRTERQEDAFKASQLCTAQAYALGALATQKFNKTKKSQPVVLPGERAFYYPQLVLGFEGLLQRGRDESQFLADFQTMVKSFQQRQYDWHQKLREDVKERLDVMRGRQCELRNRALSIIEVLSEQAKQKQGQHLDKEDICHIRDQYDSILKKIDLRLHTLIAGEIENCKQNLEKYSQLPRVGDGVEKNEQPVGTTSEKRIAELKAQATKQGEEIEKLRYKMSLFKWVSADRR